MTPVVKLGDVLRIQNGFAFKSSCFSESEGVPLIRIRDLPKDTTETRYKGEFRDEFIVNRGDLLIGMDGEFKCYKWEGPLGLLNQRVCKLRDFSRLVDQEYIFYSIDRRLRKIEESTSFATVKHISSRQIAAIEIPLPPLDEQHRIVDILNRANGIRRLRREALDKARQLIPALFVDMFGDPRYNRSAYPVRPLREVADIGSGITKGRKLDGQHTVETPYLRVANVQDGFLHLDKIKTIPVRPSELTKYALRAGDLLMTEGGDPDKLGRAALWNDEVPDCVHQNHVFRVRAKPEFVEPLYLRTLAGSLYGKQHFLRVAKRTTGIASINKTQLGSFAVLLPPLRSQREFAQRVTDTQATIAQQERTLEAGDQLVASLMAQLFDGGISTTRAVAQKQVPTLPTVAGRPIYCPERDSSSGGTDGSYYATSSGHSPRGDPDGR